MNQDLLSGGSSSRRSRGPGGPAVRGNASSTARAPQQAAEEGDEDEHMNRVVEEEEQLQQRPEALQVDSEREQPWAPSDSGASNGPRGVEDGEEDEEGPPNEVNGGEKGARWMWGTEQRRLRGQPLGEEEEEEEEEENNNSSSHQEEEEAEERTEGGEEQGREREEGEEEEEDDEDEEEMDQDSDDFEHSEESGREEEEEEEGEGEEGLRSPSLRNNVSAPNNNLDSGCTHQSSSNKKMKRKLDHGPEVRSFPSGKKPCKGPEYPSPTGTVPCPATPTTFGHIRAANGQGQQRRRITSIQPPTGLQEWLRTFQSWTGPEKLLALDELIDSCEPTQVKHMMQVIEPQFQRDFISLLPKELALYVLSFLEPKDLLQAAQTCRYWRILAEDNLLWREKCREEGIDEPLPLKKRKIVKPGFTHSPWKSAYIRQHRIDTNWRRGDLKSPKVLKGHDDHVITCLQFCGNRIVSGSDDNTLKVWSAITGKCLRTLVGHTGGVWSSQMRDNIIISGSTDRTLKVWNAETGECIHTLYGHTSTVRCMHLHEKRVVSGSRDATLRVWDIETGQCLHVLMGHVAAVRCVQYDGRRVVSGAYDFMVKVWDPETETCLHTLQGHTNRVYSLQFDGIHVVSGSLDTSIRVWDVETGNCIHTLTGHQSLTSGMELKDNILVSGNADSTVKIWDIKTGQCLQTLQGPHKHQSAVTCLQFNKNFVITSSDDGTVKLWDLKTGEFIRNLVTLESGGSGGVVWRIRASNTKLVCAVGSRNGTEETKLLVLDFDVDMK
ncbi:F-box/WD repeat-containing protein 7 isoform X2 [Amphiprion ocellaris]|nr:F-box/WD repeat-containing protein 7 isoform X2 [Amphiprion ocellaris]XP_054865745.1 F-box/WD repeat-containing protein 7 isoform X2 [Amphiprion ocellaris]XP_054865747.1 F-box/WD repeat-containing protein 7 isoform X2 [Amphiprion ocellaris]XP_054865748.1 F-box/WD repeat-containing protein 7 isoform X2 [Amphiprion ocellaris]